MPTPSVAVVAYPNVSPFHLSVPCILFGDILPGEQLFSLTVCAAEDGPIPAAHGMSVAPGAGLEALASADIVINAAAYTAVDAAETDRATAQLVNADAPGAMARAAAESPIVTKLPTASTSSRVRWARPSASWAATSRQIARSST